MTVWILDLEANGLLEDATKIWCVVLVSLDGAHHHWWTHDMIQPLDCFLKMLIRKGDEIIGHNIIEYDIPLIEKIVKLRLTNCKLIDTLVMSRVNYPDRPGGHSLENHMKHTENKKVKQDSWLEWDENMLVRCKSDVFATEELYDKLLLEMRTNVRS